MGDARTLWYPEVYQNYRSNVVDALDTDQELFLITSNGTTHHDEDLSSLTTPKSRYNEAISYLNFTAVIWMDEMKKVKLVDEQFCPQYNRWPLCVELVERREREISDGFQFTHILRSRPDLVMLKKLPPYDDLPDDEIGYLLIGSVLVRCQSIERMQAFDGKYKLTVVESIQLLVTCLQSYRENTCDLT